MKRISDKIYNMLNEQLKNEHESSLLYLAMSQWLSYNGWFGASKLWDKYSKEELIHRDKFYEYIQDRGCMPKTMATKEQPIGFDGIEAIVENSYKHEIQVTEWIKQIAKAAFDEGDLNAYEFAMKMISEQTEEEAKTLYWVDRIKMIKSKDASLYFLDKEFEDKI